MLKGPLPDERFDLIFIMLTLHHIGDVEELFRKFRRLLTSHGKLAIIDLEKENGSVHDGPFQSHKGFDRADMEGNLRKAGFEPVHYEVCYQIEKKTTNDVRKYPVFLLVGNIV